MDQIALAIVGVLGAAAGAAATRCLRTVRRAASLTNGDDRLRRMVRDQADCIRILENKVRLLTTEIDAAKARNGQLERIIRDSQLAAEVGRK